MTTKEIQNHLLEMQDLSYRDFHLNLMPGVDPDTVIGIRTPILKKFAKEVVKSGSAEDFIADLPHKYYEEMNLHAFILNDYKDFDKVVTEINRLLPYVNNWATCDGLSPKKAFTKNLNRLEEHITLWLKSSETYTIRFGIETLMSFYLDDAFDAKYLEWVSVIRSDEYYVNMMIAWYFATALAKQYEATIPYIENKKLDEWTHRKTIQKARESYRITDEQKKYLKSLK